MAFASGQAIAPILGGKLTDRFGFKGCSDILSAFTLTCAVINFCVVFLPQLIYPDSDYKTRLPSVVSTRSNSLTVLSQLAPNEAIRVNNSSSIVIDALKSTN
jgi:MFS family permease